MSSMTIAAKIIMQNSAMLAAVIMMYCTVRSRCGFGCGCGCAALMGGCGWMFCNQLLEGSGKFYRGADDCLWGVVISLFLGREDIRLAVCIVHTRVDD